mmetsp:Transcript_40779/g.118145  ORF Transcript_40779/g.118145 Transcript_40779/m.118145 type:complete len:379 (-) Transcript_40779:58-1194(-)
MGNVVHQSCSADGILPRVEAQVICGGGDPDDRSTASNSSEAEEREQEAEPQDTAAAAVERLWGQQGRQEEPGNSQQWQNGSRAANGAAPTPPKRHTSNGAATPGAVAPMLAAKPPTAAVEQESDLLERYPKGVTVCDEQQNSVRLVSLGCYCGPKLSFQKIGRGAETLPFDWIRTKLEAVLHFMRSDFDAFYDTATDRVPVPDSSGMIAFRGPMRSFWHDDPTEPSMQERYGRRIARFGDIDARSGGLVLFVRVAGHTDELRRAPELLDGLVCCFGEGSRLLLVLNFQKRAQGPAVVVGLHRLMMYHLPSEAHMRDSANFGTPYVDAVRVALDWALGRPMLARQFPNLEALAAEVTPDDWGSRGLGGLRVYDDGDGPR